MSDILRVLHVRAITRRIAKRAMEIAMVAGERHAYNVIFIALAKRLNCDLWTADDDFRRSMWWHGFHRVQLIGAYPLPKQ